MYINTRKRMGIQALILVLCIICVAVDCKRDVASSGYTRLLSAPIASLNTNSHKTQSTKISAAKINFTSAQSAPVAITTTKSRKIQSAGAQQRKILQSTTTTTAYPTTTTVYPTTTTTTTNYPQTTLRSTPAAYTSPT